MGKDNAFIKQEQDAIKKRIQRKLKIQQKCYKINLTNSGKHNKNSKKIGKNKIKPGGRPTNSQQFWRNKLRKWP